MVAVTGVTTRVFQVPLQRPIGDANDPVGRSRATVMAVQLETDEGLTGLSLGNPGSRQTVVEFAEMLVGEDPAGVRGLWQRMADRAFKGGVEGIVKEAICHLDVALWDLKAKANGEPLWKTLGASSGQVLAYASGIDLPLSDEEITAFYGRMADLGITLGKLKVGRDLEADLRRIELMRQALSKDGRTARLAIDANEYWSPKEAVRYVREVEKTFDLEWCEEPTRRWDVRGLRAVSRQIATAVATGENLNGTWDFLPLVHGEAVDIVQVGQYTSGITGALQVAELAAAYELPVATMNCPGDFMAHIGTVMPLHLGVELVWPGWEAIVDNHQVVADGWITLSDRPGHGLELRADAERYEVDELPFGAMVSTQGRRRRHSWSDHVEPGSPAAGAVAGRA
ncbi:L-alanine-DL-glutamate epimerase-like enolase superfamily enzyme [Pseudonocardia hierapolitana]|uniref:L-alanine-DL-glutamate epimerase-like enolase superfamily enzyme n=1 Tax=Pseudonocardia hierapolitana TaxID=1128676 RepID=A0A561SZB5_9PSEU|nr:mandelate racemase/muconate lactonizing enzyme family protein [Pseudonocardia hierapolitana]TWF80210.1 L-alanine-DL-glutamate epimerase-like enolase superfamily enzyme [Pseudonocardia hierapolitana]